MVPAPATRWGTSSVELLCSSRVVLNRNTPLGDAQVSCIQEESDVHDFRFINSSK